MPPFSTARFFIVDGIPTVCTVGYKYNVGLADYGIELCRRFQRLVSFVDAIPTVCTVGYKYDVGFADLRSLGAGF